MLISCRPWPMDGCCRYWIVCFHCLRPWQQQTYLSQNAQVGKIVLMVSQGSFAQHSIVDMAELSGAYYAFLC